MNQLIEQPVPQGKYMPAVRSGNMIFTSGMTPRKAGVLIFSGKISCDDPIEKHKAAIYLATQNALDAASACLEDGERIERIIQLIVYLNAEEGFTEHSRLADFASMMLMNKLGQDRIGSRAGVGVATLPSNAPVEICLVALAEPLSSFV